MKRVTIKSVILTMSLSAVASALYAQTGPSLDKDGLALPDPWTGVYAGFIVGGVFNDGNVQANQIGFANPQGVCNSNNSFNSVYPGVQIGASRQLESNWVLGILGDYSYNASQNTTFGCPCPPKSVLTDIFSVRNKMQGSLLGRVGYAYNNLLPYVSGGVSFANLGLDYSNEGNNFYSINSTQAGWRIGGGIEWGFAPAWSVSAEYHYNSYNGLNLPIPIIFGLGDRNGNGNLNLTNNNVQVAINYWIS